ncbi:MAG: hypothetical protein DRI90_27460 [Deltaproteobacteria bacterium]|nr:MAG: hypothetical protein DRI90_27460 [Deltaproteobacteria bacterium]
MLEHVVPKIKDDAALLVGGGAQATSDHLVVEPRRLGWSDHCHAVDIWRVESQGEHLAVDEVLDLACLEGGQDLGALAGRRLAKHARDPRNGPEKLVARVELVVESFGEQVAVSHARGEDECRLALLGTQENISARAADDVLVAHQRLRFGRNVLAAANMKL